MAALSATALGTYTNISSTTKTGTDPVLELIASPDDADYASDATNSTHTGEARFTLGAMPADFGAMATASIQLRYAWQAGTQVNTWASLRARIYKSDGTTALTNEATVASSITTTSFTNSSVVAFTGVDTTATKSEWENSQVHLYWFITKSKSGDTLRKQVSAAEITGTYTVASATISATKGSATFVGKQSLRSTMIGAAKGLSTWAGTDAQVSTGTTISIVPSRSSGVAPLAVFFDASGTTVNGISNPFHEVAYSWSVNDGNTDVYISDQLKNEGKGGVWAYVFEEPGTWTVRLVVSTDTGFSEETVDITVDDPETVFGDANTYYIAANTLPVAGQDGVPGGASNLVQQSDWPTVVNTYLVAGKRVFLKHDDTFTGTATAVLAAGTSPRSIGMYGTGAKPIIRTISTASNSNIIAPVTSGVAIADVRLVDLDIDGQAEGHRNFFFASGNYDISQLLVLRCDAHDLGGGFGLSVGATTPTIPDEIFIVDSTILRTDCASGNALGYGVFIGVKRCAVLGTEINGTSGTGGQHTMRVNAVQGGVFNSNLLKNAAATKELFALRAVNSAGTGPFPAGYATEFCVISHNTIELNTYAGVNVNTDLASVASEIFDIVLDSNFYLRTTSVGGQGCVVVRGERVTIRNQIANMTTGTNGPTFLNIAGDGTLNGPATDVWCYNNSVYSTGTGQSSCVFSNLSSTHISGVVVRNNILYSPSNSGTPTIVSDNGSSNSYVESNNLVTKTTNPQFVVSSPVNPEDFRLSSSSPCIDTGFVVPVYYDYFGSARPIEALWDKGAAEYITPIDATIGAYTWVGKTSLLSAFIGSTVGAYTLTGRSASVRNTLIEIAFSDSAFSKSAFATSAFSIQDDSFAIDAFSTSAFSTLSFALNELTATTIQAAIGDYSYSGRASVLSTMINAAKGSDTWAGMTSNIPTVVQAAIGAASYAGTASGVAALIGARKGQYLYVGVHAELASSGTNVTSFTGAGSPGVTQYAGVSKPTIVLTPAGGGSYTVTKTHGVSGEFNPGSTDEETYLIDGNIP